MKHYFDSLILLVNQRDILLNLDAWKYTINRNWPP